MSILCLSISCLVYCLSVYIMSCLHNVLSISCLVYFLSVYVVTVLWMSVYVVTVCVYVSVPRTNSIEISLALFEGFQRIFALLIASTSSFSSKSSPSAFEFITQHTATYRYFTPGHHAQSKHNKKLKYISPDYKKHFLN